MQPKLNLTFAALVGLCLACGCQSRELTPGEEQALRVEDAKDKAREDAIDDLYERWQYDFVSYSISLANAMEAARTPRAGGQPVRSVEELLRESQPDGDPEVQALKDEWLTTSEKYNLRLRQLQNNPERDSRSPLNPDTREKLLSPKNIK
jgi:hypothetical protein